MDETLDRQVIKGHKEKQDNNTRTIAHVSTANYAFREKAKTFILN